MPGEDSAPKATQNVDPAREFELLRAAALLNGSAQRRVSAAEIGTSGLRTLAISNGGALVGMITFLGNFPNFTHNIYVFSAAFLLFALGLAAAIRAFFLSFKASLLQSYASEADALAEFCDLAYNAGGVFADRVAKLKEKAEKLDEPGKATELVFIRSYRSSLILFVLGCAAALGALIVASPAP